MNYEQVVSDHADIQSFLAPDIIILDEAQRIKNWRTKTANAVKELKSRYAFVLTGTPVENRIDDIYSIAQFLDPHIFGSLFHFNRDFYQLDEQGRPEGYKNLHELYHRLRPIMLCRKKSDVEGELPKRLNTNFFVKMAPEQRLRYEEFEARVARLIQQASRRPLRKEEFEKLQRWLACMRMLCDTPFILDKECRISPKLKELEPILTELLDDPETKIIIFSEWERMLQLVKEMAQKHNWQFAWHTGSVLQHKRRAEIRNFKDSKNCRLFLSTDSGSVGLNLQAANVVINLDLPWNPAKLEQRIARAWRKHQLRSVQVINLICENSIEHRMLYLLEEKKRMAEGVLTGDEALSSMKMPSGRVALMERIQSLMVVEPQEMSSTNKTEPPASSQIKDSITLETLDPETLAIIQRLADAGILTLHIPQKATHDQDALDRQQQHRKKQLEQSNAYFFQAKRKQQLAHVLITSDFFEEALPPLRDAFKYSLQAFYSLTDTKINDEFSVAILMKLSSQCAELKTLELPMLFEKLMSNQEKTTNINQLYEKHQMVLNCLTEMLKNF